MPRNTRQMPLYEQVLRDLKGKIVSGSYKKGELLPSEKELIATYGVSRITIRKTLSLLADMGFIETNQGKGSTVLFALDKIREDRNFAKAAEEYYRDFAGAAQIRLMLEPEMAKMAAETATKEQIQYLGECLKEDKSSDDKMRSSFHKGIAYILGNNMLNEIIDRLCKLEEGGGALGIILPENQKEVAKVVEEQHQKIYDAIRSKNGEFAYFYMKEHTLYMSRLYEEYYSILK